MSAAAQQPGAPQHEVTLGSRVRVLAPAMRAERYIGRIDSLETTSLVLDTTGVRRRLGFDTGPVLVDEFRRVHIQLSSIDKIEISGGVSRKRSTIKGALIGAIGGALLWGLGNLPQVNATAKDFLKEAPIGLVAGGVLGGGIGYALGTERWVPAAVPR